jgi:hypothetical protein
MNSHVFLNENAPAAGVQTTLDAPANHPKSGLLRGYIVRVTGTGTAASNVTPTYADWRDTILDTVIPSLQLFAPRYSQQLCSANLTGSFFAQLFEDHYGEALPIEVAGSPVTQLAGVQMTSGGQAIQVDLFIPFETPKLGMDRLWTCPSTLLFRGDVTLKFSWVAAVTVQSVVITFSALSFRWLAMTAHGDTARLPVIHRFERRTYSQNSVDVGRGFPLYIADKRAPDQTIQYNTFIDGESIHSGALYGEDYEAAYRITNKNIVPENGVYTPLLYVPENSTVNDLTFAERSIAFQFVGMSSGTFDMHTIEPAGNVVKAALKSALGIPDGARVGTPPIAPNSAPIGNVVRKVAMNGPRTMLVAGAGGLSPVSAVAAATVPTVPSGSTGASIASAMAAGGNK